MHRSQICNPLQPTIHWYFHITLQSTRQPHLWLVRLTSNACRLYYNHTVVNWALSALEPPKSIYALCHNKQFTVNCQSRLHTLPVPWLRLQLQLKLKLKLYSCGRKPIYEHTKRVPICVASILLPHTHGKHTYIISQAIFFLFVFKLHMFIARRLLNTNCIFSPLQIFF